MKFFWYKDEIIQLYLKAKLKNLLISDHNFGSRGYQLLHRINLSFSKNPWGVLHDTTDHVKHHFNIITKTNYQYQSNASDFGSVCMQTARQILDLTDRNIAVMWSGGIDSTSALVACLQSMPLDRLIVVCTPQSVKEFPSFFHEKIENRVKIMTPRQWSDNYRDFFTVTGDGGDTVWGTLDESFYLKYRSRLNDPWQDQIDQNLVWDLDFVHEFCDWSGTDIKSWLHLRVWFYLCCKWQDKCAKVFYLHQNLTDRDAVAFYDVNQLFKSWTMNNLDKIIGNTWQEYKIPAKEFIYQYHADRDYLLYKSKVDSVDINIRLRSRAIWQRWMRVAIPESYDAIQLSSWPIIDYSEFEKINDRYGLIPTEFLSEDYKPVDYRLLS